MQEISQGEALGRAQDPGDCALGAALLLRGFMVWITGSLGGEIFPFSCKILVFPGWILFS